MRAYGQLQLTFCLELQMTFIAREFKNISAKSIPPQYEFSFSFMGFKVIYNSS